MEGPWQADEADGQFIQGTYRLEESRHSVRDHRGPCGDHNFEIIADVKAPDVSQLWVVLNRPSDLGEGLFRWRINQVFVFVFISDFEAELEDSPIGGPEGEFRCDDVGDFCLNRDFLGRIPRVLTNDRTPQGLGREKFLQDNMFRVFLER